jgi:hypothetical protein
MTNKCNLVHCTLSSSSEFKCKSSVTVSLYVPESDPAINGLRNSILATDTGDLRYSFSRKAFDLTLPAFWALLPAELPDVARDRK